MNIPKWISEISYYFRVLYKLNQDIIRVVDLDCINEYSEAEDLFYEITEKMVNLIPCKANFNKEFEISVEENDGIFDFVGEISFLRDDIIKIFDDHKEIFYKMKIIRNKHEHEPHKINANSFIESTSSIDIKFKYNIREYDLKSQEFINIVKKINEVFNKIINKFKEYKEVYDSENNESHPYLIKYSSIDYIKFNKIYDSNVLKECSRVIHELI